MTFPFPSLEITEYIGRKDILAVLDGYVSTHGSLAEDPIVQRIRQGHLTIGGADVLRVFRRVNDRAIRLEFETVWYHLHQKKFHLPSYEV